MPIYSCTHKTGSLTAEQKAAVAGEITRIHAAVTRALTSLPEPGAERDWLSDGAAVAVPASAQHEGAGKRIPS